MGLHYSGSALLDFTSAAPREWITTNGLGGFASTTLVGANSRRYHGLLTAADSSPRRRLLLLAKLDEVLEVDGALYELGTNIYRGGVHPQGYRYIQYFDFGPFPRTVFRCGRTVLEKTVFMRHGLNQTIVRYRSFSDSTIHLRLVPLVNWRDYHALARAGDLSLQQEVGERGTVLRRDVQGPVLSLQTDDGHYCRDETYYFNFYYPVEEHRGLPCVEDHFRPGYFEVCLRPGLCVFFSAAFSDAATEFPRGRGRKWYTLENIRLAQVASSATAPELTPLMQAADSFVVSTGETPGRTTVIAGYPWFTDWGRDTMISLPGLLLVPGRYREAAEVLETFAAHTQGGLVPNLFPDGAGEAAYNSVDASLWFFYAVYKYWQYSGDHRTVDRLYPVLAGIVDAFRQGTAYNIGVDDDGLVHAGAPGVQLSWMDAKAGDEVFTPRYGKPVEVNALWYNALSIMGFLADVTGRSPREYRLEAGRVRETLGRVFWLEQEGYLADVVGTVTDKSLRPNQLFTLSLPFPCLEGSRARRVFAVVTEHLLTPFGLRTLSPADPAYRGKYEGNQYSRDRSYHQGTVWPWLLGPYITALVCLEGGRGRQAARRILLPLFWHLREAGVGTVSEIFEGDFPHQPRGCYSQAWSVAELLRCYTEDVLGRRRL